MESSRVGEAAADLDRLRERLAAISRAATASQPLLALAAAIFVGAGIDMPLAKRVHLSSSRRYVPGDLPLIPFAPAGEPPIGLVQRPAEVTGFRGPPGGWAWEPA